MSAPPRVIYIDKFSVVDCLKDIGGDWEYIIKSDYDALQTKLTEAERLNNVALDAMKNASKYPEYDSRHDEYRHCCCNAKSNKPHLETCYINNAIKEIEGALK